MKTRYAVQIAAGAIIATAGLLLPFLTSGMEVFSSVLVTIGLVILMVAAVRDRKSTRLTPVTVPSRMPSSA